MQTAAAHDLLSACSTVDMGLMFGVDGSEVRVTEVVLTESNERTTTYRVTFQAVAVIWKSARIGALPSR